jgi:hypothetical protein
MSFRFTLLGLTVALWTGPAEAQTAPHYVPASAHALPNSQCSLYAKGAPPSSGIPVFTDEQGVARFHVVRPARPDSVRQLTLDCTDSAGSTATFAVDLQAEATFAEDAFNRADAAGVARPPLRGDPLRYTQSELLEAGYGLRPDPAQGADAYSLWLEAALQPGRRMSARHPVSIKGLSAGVTTTTDAPWTGAVLVGAASYSMTQATFNVPYGLPGGAGTGNTGISIWNGLGGLGTGGGLIQGGIQMFTSPTSASYIQFREYCCGQPISNTGTWFTSPTFVPGPGDRIFSQEWYCDADGNLVTNGAYGCSFVQDLTSGGILSCTLPSDPTCPSVPGLSGWTLGNSAEFAMELETQPAFTDFTPKVTMQGQAFSASLGQWVNVSTDPGVLLLTDFTKSATHLLVSLGSPDLVNFSVSANWVWQQNGAIPPDAIVSGLETDGTPLYSCRAPFQGGVHPGRVQAGYGGCIIGWGGAAQTITSYEVLVSSWAPANGGSVPNAALTYGYDSPSPPNYYPALYSCRAVYAGGVHPGKVRPGLGGCHIGWGGSEITVNPYEVLIAGPFSELPVTNGSLASGTVPFTDGPVGGGRESSGSPLYPCLGAFAGGLHPGKFSPSLGGCNIGWGGSEHTVPVTSSSILTLDWMPAPVNFYLSFPVGNEANGDPLYACQAFVSGGVYPGKYSWGLNGCSIAYYSWEYIEGYNYRVLSDGQQPPR